MTKCKWIFRNEDGSREEAVIESEVPHLGDGKAYNGKGYEVVCVERDSVTNPDCLVIADEVPL